MTHIVYMMTFKEGSLKIIKKNPLGLICDYLYLFFFSFFFLLLILREIVKQVKEAFISLYVVFYCRRLWRQCS